MKKVLLTQGRLENYSGSEVVTLELAEYFIAEGYKVSVLTHFCGNPVKEDMENLGVEIILTDTEKADTLDIGHYDYIWIHHYTLTPNIIHALADQSKRRPLVLFHHMSYQESLEIPLFATNEGDMADVILFNSAETRDELIGLFSKTVTKKIMVFDNPAPKAFMRNSEGKTHKKEKVRSLAIVSNHPPEEISEAAEILRSRGVRVDMYGRVESATIKRITPKIIRDYDAIITIGKTVQYSILSNVPVYCYDRFGGPGFLNRRNYDVAHYHNFSGRGFGKKTPRQIVNDFTDRDFRKVLREHDDLHKRTSSGFILSEVMPTILDKAANMRATVNSHTNEQPEIFRFTKYVEFLRAAIALPSRYKSKIGSLNKGNEKLSRHVTDLTKLLKEKEATLNTINSYKIVKLAKLIRKLFRN